ncbi:MAG: hypothetical protein HY897_14875 [Deltaproteobacteria bacterium]|nr:hypothetical protein [Deltaproteobacteria bacterium]
MRSWFPVMGERWVFHVDVEEIRREETKIFVRYQPVYMQQRGAVRELDERIFKGVFSPESGPGQHPLTGSRWAIFVEVVAVDRRAMVVGYRHINSTGEPITETRQMSVHVFRASFRRELSGDDQPPAKDPSWEKDRHEWQAAQRPPVRGELYVLDVTIDSVREADGKRLVKYVPQETQQYAAPRELEEKVFIGLFEPVDGAVEGINPGDEWLMMVQVTDYDDEDLAVWYRAVSSAGGRKGGIKQLSDFIFLANFKPEK